MRSYKSKRLLWCTASLTVFVTIGFVVEFDTKGVNTPFAILALDWIRSLLSGQEPLSFVPVVTGWLLAWAAVSVVLGWFLQAVIVILASEHGKPSV